MYDPEDYTEEFGELTDLGFSAREIVARSQPSQAWFRKHVFPGVRKAICISCRRFFDLSLVTRGTECSAVCRNTYTGFGGKSHRIAAWTPKEQFSSESSALPSGPPLPGTGKSRTDAGRAETMTTGVAAVTT